MPERQAAVNHQYCRLLVGFGGSQTRKLHRNGSGAALEKIGYNGRLTIEGGDLSTEEHSKRLDLIIAGK
jgi:hypothetical protein